METPSERSATKTWLLSTNTFPALFRETSQRPVGSVDLARMNRIWSDAAHTIQYCHTIQYRHCLQHEVSNQRGVHALLARMNKIKQQLLMALGSCIQPISARLPTD